MQFEDKGIVYGMEWKKLDFETRGVTYEGKSKLVPQMRNAQTRARK